MKNIFLFCARDVALKISCVCVIHIIHHRMVTFSSVLPRFSTWGRHTPLTLKKKKLHVTKGVFGLKHRCADRLVWAIKVQQKRLETRQLRMFSTAYSYRPAQCCFKTNTPFSSSFKFHKVCGSVANHLPFIRGVLGSSPTIANIFPSYNTKLSRKTHPKHLLHCQIQWLKQ